MKQTRTIIAIVAILMSLYFFQKRYDILAEIFKLGINAVPIGQMLVPIMLLTIGIVLLTFKKKKNEK